MAKILCLSDIHFDISERTDSYGDEINTSLVESFETNKFQTMLNTFERIGPIDLLVFCGDYILGRNSSEQKKEAFDKFIEFLQCIEKSEKLFNLDIKSINERIILIPGNHDIKREDGNILKEFKDRTNRYLSTLSEQDRVQPYSPIFVFDDLKVIVACVSTVDNSATKNQKLDDALSKISDPQLSQEVTNILKDDLIFDIPSITEKSKNDFIDKNRNFFDENKYENYFKIVATHHPLMDGIESGNTIKKFNTTIGGYSFMKTASSFGYNLFLHGHLHDKSCIKLTDYNMETPTPIMQIGLPKCKLENENYVGVLIDTSLTTTNEHTFSGSYLKYSEISRSIKQVRMFGDENAIQNKYLGSKILVDYEIKKILEEGKIIEDGDFCNIQAASYDCTLGYKYKRSNNNTKTAWENIKTEELHPTGTKPCSIEIAPNETILIFTYEKFNIPDDMVLHASPISSWARKGLNVELSYFVDPGFSGNFCFPVKNNSKNKLKINSQEPIMSIEFVQLSEPCQKNWKERHSDKLIARKNYES